MSLDMHSETAAAVRAELAAIGTRRSALQRRQRRTRVITSVVAIATVAGATSAAALVSAGLPGTTTISALGTSTTVTRTGPALIDIGRAPATAGAVIVDITCLNDVGMVQMSTLDGGSGASCSRGRGPYHVANGRLPEAGTTTFSIQASPDTRWRATLQYASAVSSDWGVNAKGQTFGVDDASGNHPDLVPATASNGRRGWALWSEYIAAEKTATVNVYESDGTTIIGRTQVTVRVGEEVPLDQGLVDEWNSVQKATPAPHDAR
jgi:hypothetical protein